MTVARITPARSAAATVRARPEGPPAAVVLVDQAVLLDAGEPHARRGMARARAAGLRTIIVEPRCGCDVATGAVAPAAGEHRRGEVLPQFVRRVCDELGVPGAAAVAISSQRPLLSAADGAGGRGVMVPGPDTPPFQIRALHVAPDLSEAVDVLIAWTSTYAC